MARKGTSVIEVHPKFLDEYKAIRGLLWDAGKLLDMMADAVPSWPAGLRTRYVRLQSRIDRKHKNWSASGTRR